MSPTDAARVEAVLEILERDAWLKEEMLDELREAERVGEGLPMRRTSRVDLADLVRSTTEALVPLARERDITLHAGCAASSVVISADATDLTLIVSRLLACAIASSTRGSSIDCHLSLDAEWVRLVVRVHGGDLDVGFVPRVLESVAGRSDHDEAAWKAFGLATVRALVDRYGGSVRVELQGPRSDSIFTVSLPGDHVTG